MNEKAIALAKETFDTIERRRVERISLQIQHAKEIGAIDHELNMLYSKLSAALDMANQ